MARISLTFADQLAELFELHGITPELADKLRLSGRISQLRELLLERSMVVRRTYELNLESTPAQLPHPCDGYKITRNERGKGMYEWTVDKIALVGRSDNTEQMVCGEYIAAMRRTGCRFYGANLLHLWREYPTLIPDTCLHCWTLFPATEYQHSGFPGERFVPALLLARGNPRAQHVVMMKMTKIWDSRWVIACFS